MDITRQHQERQEAKRLQDRISSLLGDFQIGTLLNRSGMRKLRGGGIGSDAFLGNLHFAL